jgi:hypothetical protein
VSFDVSFDVLSLEHVSTTTSSNHWGCPQCSYGSVYDEY